MTNQAVADLITRSNRLGADPKNTNYAGGNTSAKGTETDPVTGEPVELLWVKGSGGDLGTLTEPGLAVLRLDRMRALVDVYPGVDREDEMVAAFDYCLHGKGGAAPSIDTAMHGLVDAAHVDHLHPDSGHRRSPPPSDGEALTKEIFGDKVVWVPWRRPGFQLGLDIAAIKAENPQAIGCILGGHGITAWGATSEESEQNSLWIIEQAETYIAENGKAEPFGAAARRLRRPAGGRAAGQGRRARADPAVDRVHDKPMIGHFSDDAVVLDFLAAARAPAARGAGHLLPRPLPAHQGQAAGARPARRTRSVEDSIARLQELHEAYREDYQAYYDRHATPESPAIRGADPAIILVPGVGMFCYGKDKQTARVAGEFYLNAINVMRGAEGDLHLRPDRRGREVPDRVLGAGGGQAAADAQAEAARHPDRAGDRGRLGHRQGHRHPAGRRGRLRGHRRPGRREGAGGRRGDRQTRRRHRRRRRRHRRRRGAGAIDGRRCWPSAAWTWWSTTPACRCPSRCWKPRSKDWDLQHNVMAKGSFLVSKAAAKVLIDQQLGGDIIYISCKNSVFAGPNNIAYSATKADQAHQVRLLAAELGEHGVRVNGINPDGVVRGSGHLRRRLGRQARRGLRRGRGGPGQVLRPAHPAQARGAARARRQRRRSR